LEVLLLDRPETAVRDKGKTERQLKPNITAVRRVSDELANRPNEPNLRHAQDCTHNAEAESKHCGDAGGELGGLFVDLGDVAGVTALEDEVLGERDAFVDGEPVSLIAMLVMVRFAETG
jgi:hypothetical protein